MNVEPGKKHRLMKKTNLFLSFCREGVAGVMVLWVMLAFSVGAWAQSYYVFKSGNYYMTVNNGALDRTETFNPSTCIWTLDNNNLSIEVGGTRYYFGYTRSGSGSWQDPYSYSNPGLVTNNTKASITINGTTASCTVNTRSNGRGTSTTYYIRYSNSGNTFQFSSTNSNLAAAYPVTIQDNPASLSSFTIQGGTSSMNAVGSSSFTHTTSTFTRQQTNYRFNGQDHIYYGPDATPSYSWSLSNMDGYASVSDDGVVSYSTLIPERERTVTLTCTASAGGLTQTATRQITFVNTNILYNPVISYQNDGATNVLVSLSYPEVDNQVLLYYTTDGSDPSSEGTQYTGPFSVSSGTTIKVVALKNQQSSNVVQQTVRWIAPPSGVNDSVVTLNDLEDHNWTLYQGVDNGVDEGHYNSAYVGRLYRPDPRNVKIVYYGNSTNNIKNGNTVVGTSNNVKVGIDADATTFVYYKTLEKIDDKYTYRTIPNPFSVRPKVGDTYYGFSYWRVKSVSGGSISGVTNSQMNADVEYEFVPTSEYSTNCISMTVELEAVWEPATVLTEGTFNNSNNKGSVERNFFILSGTGAISPLSYPCTYTSIYPNGTTNGTNVATAVSVTKSGTFSAAADSKIEYVILNDGGSFVANARNVTIGRGTRGTGTSATRLLGINADATNPNFHFRVESGQYDYMSFVGGYYTNTGGDGKNANSNQITVNNVNNTRIRITMGSDYDRATGNNDLLQMQYAMSMGRSSSFSQANRTNPHTVDLTIKSGKLGTAQFMETTTNSIDYLQGGAGYGHYISCGSSQTYVGRRNVFIEGGEMSTIGSGIDRNNATTNDNGSGRYNVGFLSFYLRMSGGIVHGNIYGGAAYARAGGDKMIVQTGGQIKGWVAAGCNGTKNEGGQTYGESFVYIGGNGKVDSENNNRVLGYANGGNVYAAGAGIQADNSTCGEMSDGSNLVIADDCVVERGIYGGGNYGYTKTSTHTYIYITGGTNKGVTDNATSSKGAVYGGANNQSGPTIKLYMTGGKMLGGVYGGCNTKGTINGSVTMQINGGQVGLDESHTANIHGGGYGENTVVNQNVDITIGKSGSAPNADGVVVYGDVYGGSALGSVNVTVTNGWNNSSTYTYTDNTHTNVTLNAGYIHGSIYGGALGSSTVDANVYGPVAVKVYGGSVMKTDADGRNGSGAVYGCNNIGGEPQRSVTVDIYGTNSAPSGDRYALFAVYGGGNRASYSKGTPLVTVHNCDNSIEYVYGGGNAAHITNGNTDVTIWGGNKIGNVFGGGNGQVYAANISGNTNVKIYGGTIGDVYGGSNTNGTIGGTISVNVNAQAEGGNAACPVNIDNVYGGGNKAASASGNVTIGCTGTDGMIGAVYGGANQANITDNINLNITGGSIRNVFGGNNNGGVINGTITVTIDWDNSCPSNYLENVYGGGNKAAYTAFNSDNNNWPKVFVRNATVEECVFGGGLGATARVTGNPRVKIGVGAEEDDDHSGTLSGHQVTIKGSVYGGGSAAPVTGNTLVDVDGSRIGGACTMQFKGADVNGVLVDKYVFGGGLGSTAKVTGNTQVKVRGNNARVGLNVYGGGHGAAVTGNTKVQIGE